MQKTRQRILEYLKTNGEATVEDLSATLDNLTPVTVRHHLDVMRSEGLLDAPEIRRRASPGRPCYIYRLSANARAHFPHNLQTLTSLLVTEIKSRLDEKQVNVIFEGVADRMSDLLEPPQPGETMEQRLTRVAEHLTEHGYMASWETRPEGLVLHTRNCPYGVADTHPEVCMLDLRYVTTLLGVVPRRIGYMVDGDSSCSYLIPYSGHIVASISANKSNNDIVN